MKKIVSTALIAVVLSTMIVDTVSAARSNAPQQRRNAKKGMGRRGGRRAAAPARMRANAKKVQIVLETARKTDNPVVKQEAIRTASELAKELLMNLQDRTWAGDVLGKYTEEQVAIAGKKYTDLAIQKEQLMRDIDMKQAELDAMTVKGYIWSSVEGGKEAAHKVASQELAELKSTLRDVNKAMRDQAVIAGKEYCNSIRMAIGALTAATVAGAAWGIDKYKYEGKGMIELRRMGSEFKTAAGEQLAMKEGESYGAYGKRQLGDLGVYSSDKFGSFKTWLSDGYKYARELVGLDKKALTEDLDTADKVEKELAKIKKQLEDQPDNKALMNRHNELVDRLQELVDAAEAKKGLPTSEGTPAQ